MFPHFIVERSGLGLAQSKLNMTASCRWSGGADDSLSKKASTVVAFIEINEANKPRRNFPKTKGNHMRQRYSIPSKSHVAAASDRIGLVLSGHGHDANEVWIVIEIVLHDCKT